MNDKAVKTEHARLLEVLEGVSIPDKKISALAAVIDNLAWMKVKLDDTRKEIESAPVAVHYDNGGGQTGIRENPLFKGYEKLFHSYMEGMRVYLAVLPDDMQDSVMKDTISVLDKVKALKEA